MFHFSVCYIPAREPWKLPRAKQLLLQISLPKLHVEMTETCLKTTAPSFHENKLDSVFPRHSRAQRSTSISVAAPPLYQLAVRRRMAEMTCWWGRVIFVLIRSPRKWKSLKFVLAFSLYCIFAWVFSMEDGGGFTFIWIWNVTLLIEDLGGIGTEPIKRSGQFNAVCTAHHISMC